MIQIKKLQIFTWLVLALMLTACGASGPQLRVEDAWVRPDPLWENAAGYFVIYNDGDQPDYLIGVSAGFTKMESMHQTVMEGDIHKMEPVDRLEISADGHIVFQPLSYHLMLMGMQPGLEYGQTVTLVFEFENSEEISVEAELRSE